MYILSILSILKTLLFINMTNVEWNKPTIFLITIFIAIFIISSIDMGKFKYKNGILMGFYLFFSLVMLVDVVYYSYFNALPSVMMLGQAGQLGAVSDSVKSLLSLKYILFLIDLPFVYYYLFKYRRNRENILKEEKRFIVPSMALILTILLFVSTGARGEINSIKMQEIFSFHFTDIADALSSDEDYASANEIFGEEDLQEYRNRARLKEGKYTGIGRDKNLILIQVEALQGFVVDLIYDNQEVTPNLNKFLHDKSTIYYDEYYQLVGRGNTADAEFVTNNSLHPSMESPTYSQYQDNTFYGLPWLLRDNGYNAWVFHPYKKEFWNRAAAYENQGFQRFISEEDYEFEEVIGLGMTDKDFFHDTIDYLKKLEEKGDPFYSFLITLTSHNPYDMPEEYHKLDLRPEHIDTLLGNYLQSIHYFDEALGEFLEDLKEEDLYEKSVIALYGDHFAIQNTDEEINDIMTEFLGHKYNYDDIMKVPLGIHVPGEEIGETNSIIGSKIDFFPTIMNIMGYDNTKGLVFGRDLNNYTGYTNVKPQTIMRKGSFLDEDILFEIARTEIFDHSRAFDKKTKEPLEIDEFRERYEEAIREINQSNFILEQDLLKTLLEDGDLDFDSIGKEDIEGKEIIYKIDLEEDIIEELNGRYKEGDKIFSLDIEIDKEGEVEIGSKDIQPIIDWMEDHPDAYILFSNSHERKAEVFKRAKFRYERFQSHSIVEIDNFDEHYFITSYGYKNLLLNEVDYDYTDEEILDFLNVHKIFGVVLDKNRASSDLAKQIKALGVDVYIESEKAFSLR